MTEQTLYSVFGTYNAKSGDVEAIMNLKTSKSDSVRSGLPGFRKFVGEGKGDVYYFANVKFSTMTYEFDYGVKYEAIVDVSYGCRSLKGIFERLHANESSIEGLLCDEFDSKEWMHSRNVMKCIVMLEDKIGAR